MRPGLQLAGLGGIATAFWFWMVIECMRRGDRDWIFVVVFLGPLGGLAYFVVNVLPGVRMVSLTGSSTRRRRRIQELEALRHLGLTPAQTLELADLYFAGKRLVINSEMRCAAGGSMFASTATTYPEFGQILRSPFIPGAPPPWPKHRTSPKFCSPKP